MKKLIIFLCMVIGFANQIQSIYLSSYNYEKIGDYKDAIKVLIPLHKKYPNGYTLNLRLGYLFFMNKNYQNAIEYYKKASLSITTSFEPKLGMMRVYLVTGKYSKVTQIGYSIIKVDFYNYFANLYLLQALKSEKKYNDALAIANKMVSIYPTDVRYLVNLAKIYEKIDPAYAKKIYQDSVLVLDPNNVAAKVYLNLK